MAEVNLDQANEVAKTALTNNLVLVMKTFTRTVELVNIFMRVLRDLDRNECSVGEILPIAEVAYGVHRKELSVLRDIIQDALNDAGFDADEVEAALESELAIN